MRAFGILRQISTGGVQAPLLSEISLHQSQEILIGREPSCQVALNPNLYTVVSRRHVLLRPQGQTWEVVDLGSANGTFINGQRLQGSRILQAGDRLTLGDNGPVFSFELQSQAHNPKASPDPGSHIPVPGPIVNPNSNLTLTQLFPIAATGKDLSSKGYLIPGVLTVIFVVLMFATIGEPGLFNLLLGFYIAGTAYYYIYQLCGKRKAWWIIIGAALLTAFLLVSPVLSLFILVFREILPGNISDSDSILQLFIGMFFGAGLMEEILKAIPIFAAMALGNLFAATSRGRERIGVTEPLDGILLGTASAVGFTLIETLGQYVPNIVNEVSLQVDPGTGELLGLQLLIPRILGSVAGHMAYSGYFGYFIGLSVLKPSKRWTILSIGCLTSALIHALWNTVGSFSSLLLAVVGVCSYAFLAAAILKARALSPTRADNFATRIAK
ncbi:PrsW family intramembrane metalloprotease [Synechococcus moorigangaii CMS01]|nr:PrsW family intramembrane metalloprotease [Synechococcus moorigangaii CMS01]